VNRRPFGAHIRRHERDEIGLGLVDQYVLRLPKMHRTPTCLSHG
jgi:hypothetical protein